MQTTRLSWKDRADRRKQMASEVTDTASVGKVAAKYGVTLETVRGACRIFAPHKLLSYAAPQPVTVKHTTRRRDAALTK